VNKILRPDVRSKPQDARSDNFAQTAQSPAPQAQPQRPLISCGQPSRVKPLGLRGRQPLERSRENARLISSKLTAPHFWEDTS
jgi:hypothetical protein